MDKKQIEAYSYYKELYPEAIVLYRIGNNYVVLGDDAAMVTNSLALTTDRTPGVSKFPYDDLATLDKLGDTFQLKMVAYRNDDGELDYPDIQRLKQEEDEDY